MLSQRSFRENHRLPVEKNIETPFLRQQFYDPDVGFVDGNNLRRQGVRVARPLGTAQGVNQLVHAFQFLQGRSEYPQTAALGHVELQAPLGLVLWRSRGEFLQGGGSVVNAVVENHHIRDVALVQFPHESNQALGAHPSGFAEVYYLNIATPLAQGLGQFRRKGVIISHAGSPHS
jgi:hypothetical protein